MDNKIINIFCIIVALSFICFSFLYNKNLDIEKAETLVEEYTNKDMYCTKYTGTLFLCLSPVRPEPLTYLCDIEKVSCKPL